jgi:dTDP-4-amino-4,6-dideoxygalactose transaminase
LAVSRAISLEAPDAGFGPEAAPAPARVAVARPKLPPAEAVLPYLQRIDEARWYSNFGPLLSEFEARLAGRYRPGTHVITVANATQALTLALSAMNLPAGGFVVMPAWTFVATAHAIVQAGLQPWLVDVDPVSGMLEPETVLALSRDLKRDVATVIPVCAFGDVSGLGRWRAFNHATGVPVLVDAAAAFDALGDARLPACVSLHATKAMGIGEGGYLATEDAELAARVRKLTTFGFQGSREAQIPATNAKLSEYAAAVGLAGLDAWPGDRLRWMRMAQMLRIALIGQPQVTFQAGWGSEWVTSVCHAGLPEGSAPGIAEALSAAGVDTRAWWGKGCHREPAFAACRREPLPVTERLAEATLGLPFSIDMDAAEIGRLAEALQTALA